MTNHFVLVLNNLLNFGIKEDEVLSSIERIKRVGLFENSFRIEDYLEFFEDLEEFLLNEEISLEEKDRVVILLMDVLSSSWKIQGNISLFPPVIISIYNSYISFLKINLLFERISIYDPSCSDELKKIINSYINFIEDPINEFFVHYAFSKIYRFYERLQVYLDTESIYGIIPKYDIKDVDLLLQLGKIFGDLNASRKY